MASSRSFFSCLRPKCAALEQLNGTAFSPRRSSRIFSTTSSHGSTQAERRRRRDPYALEQSRQRRAANIARQAVLQNERAAAMGDPIRGEPTPFIQSLDSATPSVAVPAESDINKSPGDSSTQPPSGPEAQAEPYINHLLQKRELDETLESSRYLTQPPAARNRNAVDPDDEKSAERQHQRQHENAVAALNRIFSLANASSKERTATNVYRCIETFGRHRTDGVLAPKPVAKDQNADKSPLEKTPRAGPDTGSSEVQAAILTAKIHALAKHMEGTGRKDKHNKRTLRLLVHKRQKLLRYLRRKERGGERWQHLMQTLGLSEASWKGEITLR